MLWVLSKVQSITATELLQMPSDDVAADTGAIEEARVSSPSSCASDHATSLSMQSPKYFLSQYQLHQRNIRNIWQTNGGQQGV